MSITPREFAAAAVVSGLASASDNLFATMLEARSVPFGVHTFSFHEITEGGMPAVDEILADTTSD